MLSLAFTTWNAAYFYSSALFLLLAPKSLKIKASSNIDELQDSGSHNGFGICRLIRLKNKWLGFFWAIHRELCWDETLAYEAHYDHTAAVTFSTQQRKAGFSVHVNSIMKQLRGRPASATTFIPLKNLKIHSSERSFQIKIKGSLQPFHPRLPCYRRSHK